MSISLDEVRHVAKLARLDLDEAEVLALQGELNALLGHFRDIEDMDVSDIEPTAHAITLRNAWAEDEIGVTLPRPEVLRNTMWTKAGLFVVPTIIED